MPAEPELVEHIDVSPNTKRLEIGVWDQQAASLLHGLKTAGQHVRFPLPATIHSRRRVCLVPQKKNLTPPPTCSPPTSALAPVAEPASGNGSDARE